MLRFQGLDLAECIQAFQIINPAVQQAMKAEVVKRSEGFLVVLNPRVQWTPGYLPGDEAFEQKAVLFSSIFGDTGAWEHRYDDIALSKAFISWKTGLPSRQVQQEAPWLYERKMTKYGGSAVDKDLVVAFSGVEEWFDQMISEMMLAAIKGVLLHKVNGPDGVMESDSAFVGD